MNAERGMSRIYEHMRDAILRLEWRPGLPVDEAGVAEKFNVSRTPVREAIIQLIADGLIVREGRIACVAPIEFDDVPYLLDALLMASRAVQRLAAEQRSPEHVRAIQSAMLAFETERHSADPLRRSELNLAFHLAVSAACRNRHVRSFYETTLKAQIRLARACFSEGPAASDQDEISVHMDLTAQQHRALFDAIRSGDTEAADRLAIEHETLSRQRLQRQLFTETPALTRMPLSIPGEDFS